MHLTGPQTFKRGQNGTTQPPSTMHKYLHLVLQTCISTHTQTYIHTHTHTCAGTHLHTYTYARTHKHKHTNSQLPGRGYLA